MQIKLSIKNDFQIKISENLQDQLMICSHERSGTHFLMNTLSAVSHYSSNPWLNYDLHPLGSRVNFFSHSSTNKFINDLSKLTAKGKKVCNASILKSHFPLSHLGQDVGNLPLKIIYIWREPADTIASLWKYMHKWSWNEGPKTQSPLELACTRPCGQSQRYQTANCKDYFERWAIHVMDGIEECKCNPNAYSISYNELLKAHSSTTMKICNNLDIEIIKKPEPPSRNENVVIGASIDLQTDDMKRLQNYCNARLEEFPALKAYLGK